MSSLPPSRPDAGLRFAGGGSARAGRRARFLGLPPLWRLVSVALGGWAVAATLVALYLRYDLHWLEVPDVPIVEDYEVRRLLLPTRFETLPGWREDTLGLALSAFLTGCESLRRQPADRAVVPQEVGGRVEDWLAVCALAEQVPPGDELAARRFFESEFRPFAVLDGRTWIGLFTGYYEPLLRGSRGRRGPYQYPLHRPPPDLVSVDLGEFRQSMRGQRLAGRVVGGRLRPLPDRAAIEAGALDGRGLVLLWVDDPVDAFFLQIQGSGTVELPNGRRIRVGYAGQNGHPYYAIGRELVKRQALELEQVSMQSIRAWLKANPEEASEVMATNASYVFFRELDGDGPLGSLGVPLQAGRSVAVDRSYLPLGAPLWIDTTAPSARAEDGETVRRLVMAHDTGGAIRGPVRADVFWGAGEEAAEVAGRMRSDGRLWLVLPNRLAARVVEARSVSR